MTFGRGTDDNGGMGPNETNDWDSSTTYYVNNVGNHGHGFSGTTDGISTDHSHAVNVGVSGSTSSGGSGSTGSSSGSTGASAPGTNAASGVIGDGGSGTTGSSGSGTGFENRPPYYSLAYIMKL